MPGTSPITLRGLVTGRSRRNPPVDQLGNAIPYEYDQDVRLSVTIYPPGAPAAIFVVGMEQLACGTLEIGQEVTVTIAPVPAPDAQSESDTGVDIHE